MTQAPPEPPRTERPCPRCGNPTSEGQLLCTACGERIAIAYRRPPGWRLPVAIVTLVALLAGGGLAIALSDIGEQSEQVASAPAPTQELTESQPPPAAPPAGEEPDPPPAPTPEPSGGSAGAIEEWPARESAYTVILLSTATRDGAESKAREALDQGIEAGVLQSSDYASLNPGFWVAYGGRFESQDDAQTEAERFASLGFAGAYVRFVSNSGD